MPKPVSILPISWRTQTASSIHLSGRSRASATLLHACGNVRSLRPGKSAGNTFSVLEWRRRHAQFDTGSSKAKGARRVGTSAAMQAPTGASVISGGPEGSKFEPAGPRACGMERATPRQGWPFGPGTDQPRLSVLPASNGFLRSIGHCDGSCAHCPVEQGHSLAPTRTNSVP